MSLLDSEKIFYERFWCLLNDRQLMTVFEKLGPAAFRRSSVLEGFESFVKENDFRGDTVIEIGTLKGLTALILSRYFKHVITIDIVDDLDKYAIAEMLGVRNVYFVTVPDNAAKSLEISKHNFDAAFVDGDHAADTPQDFALVKRCGRVLAHEFWDAQPVVERTLRAAGGNLMTSGKFALWIA